MAITIQSIATPGADQLSERVERLQALPSQSEVVLTLMATGDAAAKQRGFIPALRRSLESNIEPEPTNLGHAWGDWPKDLFAALEPYTQTIDGLGVAVFAWPGGRNETISCAAPLRPVSYYLTQPVTFPLVETLQAMKPVVAVELHRSHAILRGVGAGQANEVARIVSTLDEKHHKTGAEGQEHAETREREVLSRYLSDVARQAASAATDARAVVAVGGADLRRQFTERFTASLPLGQVDWNPDPHATTSNAATLRAADDAVAAAQLKGLNAAAERSDSLDDWDAICGALRDGQLHELWLAAGTAEHRYICNHCLNLVHGSAPCRACGASAWERLPLPEYVLRQATRSDARLHFAAGAAEALLARRTGVVATRRF